MIESENGRDSRTLSHMIAWFCFGRYTRTATQSFPSKYEKWRKSLTKCSFWCYQVTNWEAIRSWSAGPPWASLWAVALAGLQGRADTGHWCRESLRCKKSRGHPRLDHVRESKAFLGRVRQAPVHGRHGRWQGRHWRYETGSASSQTTRMFLSASLLYLCGTMGSSGMTQSPLGVATKKNLHGQNSWLFFHFITSSN